MKVLLRIIVTLTLFGAIAVPVRWYLQRSGYPPVKLAAVDVGAVQGTGVASGIGVVRACQHALLSPAIAGRVTRLAVHPGSQVRAGDMLMEIRDPDLREKVEIDAAAARVAAVAACRHAAYAEHAARRISNLRRDSVREADEDANTFTTEAQSAHRGCAAAETTAKAAAARVDHVQGAEQSILRTPFAGTVVRVNVEPGILLVPEATPPAIEVIDTSCLRVHTSIAVRDLPLVQVGMKTCITPVTRSDRRYCSGVVSRTAAAGGVQGSGGTTEIEIEVRDARQTPELRPDDRVHVEFPAPARVAVLRIPSEAIIHGAEVLVFDRADHSLHARRIRAGIAGGGYTEILEGLQAGERVAVDANRNVIGDGTRVKPVVDNRQ